MPRYLVERSFPTGMPIPTTAAGARICKGVVAINAEHGVTWLHSYVSTDKKRTFCVYEADSPEAIRAHADASDLPVDEIIPVADTVIVRPDPAPVAS